MSSTSKPPAEVLQLIERFDDNIDSYRSGQYNETQVRLEFIDPFFKALGWDVHNEKGYAEAYKDVIHEVSIKIGQATKAPDYCFRIGKTPKFFLEAKKPSVNLKEDLNPAFQLRRYAWSAKLPLSILTDFEEFAVYDCRVKPYKTDLASTARVSYLTYQEYENKWEELLSIFSREAVLKGSFDKYAESSKLKRGTAAVDDAFLKEIEEWRSELARTIALRNPKLTQRELNFSVQRTIDRIIFLRICEDRGIELYGRLQGLLNGENVYRRLCDLFHRADERYNSGLFHFNKEKNRDEPPDELTLELTIDDKPLKDMIKSLYYPESAYEFSVLPADILGQVYEQFLGKVIRLTTGHRAVIEDKPEVKKAGGVYYTPTYIVDYIVKNTVGKLLNSGEKSPLLLGEGQGEVPQSADSKQKLTPLRSSGSPSDVSRRDGGVEESTDPLRSKERIASPSTKGTHRALTPKQASKLRILDPACGSGSFLIGAYQYLLDWHRDRYVNDGPEKYATGKKPALYQVSVGLPAAGSTKAGDWRLTTAERKRILLNNIYGVDIDPQAVEVTKLSLLLKVLEGESDQSLSSQLKLLHERALPDLSSNIKCGNSLIGPDFYDGQLSLMDDEERMRINAFDWKKEFPEILGSTSPLLPGEGEGEVGQGGFDAVIGNPPYVVISADLYPTSESDYVNSYAVAQYKTDLFHLFIQRGIDILRKTGYLGFIVPSTWFTLQFTRKLREYVLRYTALEEIVNFQHKVFENADVHTGLIFLNKRLAGLSHQIALKNLKEPFIEGDLYKISSSSVGQHEWLDDPDYRFEIRLSGPTGQMVNRLIHRFSNLEDVARASLGIQAYNSSKHSKEQIKNRVFHSRKRLSKEYLPELAGSDVGRYLIDRKKGEWIKYGPWLHDYRTMDWLTGPRILVREISGKPPYRIYACYTDERYCNYKTILNVNPSESTDFSMKYLLGILNSRLISLVYPLVSNKMIAASFPRLSVGDVKRLPIRTINFSDRSDKASHDKMVSLVERMLELHKQLAAAKTEHEKTALQRQIDATDNQIDRLVYELYGLTEEEIKIVEGA